MELFNFLSLNGDMQKYLPPTELSQDFEQVLNFINRHEKVIFKPLDLSRGRGMCIVEKSGTLYQISDYRYRHRITAVLNSQSALQEFFSLNQVFFNKYLVQKYISLARVDNSRFDVRVVMQKQKRKTWVCTGTECRVSSNSHLTNISRGGYAMTLDEALRLAFKKNYEYIPGKIDKLCLNVCRQMDGMGHNFAEFGMDIAVDEKKSIWLIEVNVFPSFKGFKSTDYNTYLNIRYTPLLYALSLTKFGAEGENI
jgi:glutathione synthase/RimK-type ligase-like ATP-grasp enzyme